MKHPDNRVTAKSVRADRAPERRGMFLASSVPSAASALLLAALSVASAALGQGQAGAAAPDAAATAHGQPSSAAKTQPAGSATNSGANSTGATARTQATAPPQNSASSPAEPRMQDQSAPAAESLGEAARRARAQKTKSAVGAPKVYTDDKLSQLSGHGVSVVGDGNSGGGSSSGESSFTSSGENSSGNGAASGGKNDEQYWRGRARAIHDQMAQCDQEISKLQDEIAKYGAVSVDPQSGAMQSIIYVNDRNAKIKQIEERKAGLQGQLDALEDEGRKAGADSGWFR
jgi:hypothetical protein